MSQPLSSDASKTTSHYSIALFAIFSESWHRIKGIKKAFWGGLALFFLMMVGAYVLFGFLLAVCDVFHWYHLSAFCQFFVGGFVETLRLLLSISLIFLALQHLRHQTVSPLMVFEFLKAWKPLAFIGVMLYLFNLVLLFGTNFILHHVSLTGLKGLYHFGVALRFIVFVLLLTYLTLFATMAMLLILDKKIQLKQSVSMAFTSLNRHVVKNVALLLLASLVFFVASVVTLGIGLIWLFPWLSLVVAIQYQQIFCQGKLGS